MASNKSEGLDVFESAYQAAELAAQTRSRKLNPDELEMLAALLEGSREVNDENPS